MNTDREYDLIITVVNRGFADQVVEAARKAGAQGSTVFYARGTGIHELEKFFSISIQPEKEIILNLVKHSSTKTIIHSIIEAAGLSTEGKGLSFSLPVSDVAGVIHNFNDLDEIDEDALE
ncbi:P-II family nitrogen regulator [Anaerovorax odorimutans]|uniref:P-II family nitrogen regulator n=1 Tax=Anaerovorax odorimutans TaxID=109327 RepID=UPI0003FB57E2|nr:P-II family nitrogen regulator [Anaerovorax odorimutans]